MNDAELERAVQNSLAAMTEELKKAPREQIGQRDGTKAARLLIRILRRDGLVIAEAGKTDGWQHWLERP